MTLADIADNKWEVEAAKAPHHTPSGYVQIGMTVLFGLFMVMVVVGSIMGIASSGGKSELEKKYENLNESSNGAAAAAE